MSSKIMQDLHIAYDEIDCWYATTGRLTQRGLFTVFVVRAHFGVILTVMMVPVFLSPATSFDRAEISNIFG